MLLRCVHISFELRINVRRDYCFLFWYFFSPVQTASFLVCCRIMSAVAFSGLIARRGFGPSLRVNGGRTTQNLGMTGQTVCNNSWDPSVPITVAYLRAAPRRSPLFSV